MNINQPSPLSPSPEFMIGAMRWGTQVPTASAHRLLDSAAEIGGMTVDTANNYAFWVDESCGDHSETAIGQWFAARGSSEKDRVAVATKIGARPTRPGAGFDDVEGLSPQAIRRQVLGSLRRLHRDHIDILYAHIDDAKVALEESTAALQSLVQEGLVRRIAGSNLTGERLQQALATAGSGPSYAAVQNRFTYLQPQEGSVGSPQVLLDEVVLRVATQHNLVPVGYSPLLAGAYRDPKRLLQARYRTDCTESALARLSAAARELDLNVHETILSWMRSRRESVTPVVGISSEAQLHAAVRAAAIRLPLTITDALDAARLGD